MTDIEQPLPVPSHSDCLIVIYHPDKTQEGKRTNLDGPKRVGRAPDNDFVLEHHAISRRHASIEPALGSGGWELRDLGSKNGTRLNDNRLQAAALLRHGDRVKMGSVIVKYLSGADVEAHFLEEIYQLAITDHLTRLPNRQRLEDQLQKEFVRARRHARKLSLLLLDIDHFKSVNDTHGHQAGDALLSAVGQLLSARARSDDLAARLGGEEFVVLTPETDLRGATMLAEALRQAVQALVVPFDGVLLRATVSIGCAELLTSDHNPGDLLTRADVKLYEAKDGGRNRVCC